MQLKLVEIELPEEMSSIFINYEREPVPGAAFLPSHAILIITIDRAAVQPVPRPMRAVDCWQLTLGEDQAEVPVLVCETGSWRRMSVAGVDL